MIVQESSVYPLDASPVQYYFCIHRYKKREKPNICNFILLILQRIKKRKGRYFKRFVKKKATEVLKKRAKMLGFLLSTLEWNKKIDGSKYRSFVNGILLLRSDGLKRGLTRKRLAVLKPHVRKILGGVAVETLRKVITDKYIFLKLFRFKTF